MKSRSWIKKEWNHRVDSCLLVYSLTRVTNRECEKGELSRELQDDLSRHSRRNGQRWGQRGQSSKGATPVLEPKGAQRSGGTRTPKGRRSRQQQQHVPSPSRGSSSGGGLSAPSPQRKGRKRDVLGAEATVAELKWSCRAEAGAGRDLTGTALKQKTKGPQK